MSDFDRFLVPPGGKFKLGRFPTSGKALKADRSRCEAQFQESRREIITLQERLYAAAKQKLLIVFQAMDGGGKDGTIRSVFQGVNPQGVQVTAFKAPSADELAHDFLWRVHRSAPAAGMIGVFNRSHYEDVLVVRVHNLVPKSVWKPRYELINQFENLLTATGTRVIKFLLHISREEQKQRFEERIQDPAKRWKFDPADLEKRQFWDAYQEAFDDMLDECSPKSSPWYVVPGDENWFRDSVVSGVIAETLRDMNPQFPDPPDVTGVVVN